MNPFLKNVLFIFLLSTLFSCGGCGDDENNGVVIVPFDDVEFEICDDETDNDDDGYTDCFDPDCQSNEACRFEPANPETLAPKNDALTIGDFWESNRFLVEGNNAIVRNVDIDKLNKNALSVLRVRLTDHDGNPKPKVRASIVNHPEYGYTFSRENGEVDFLVNAGGRLVIRFDDKEIVPIDIAFSPPTNAFSIGNDAVVTALDTVSTTVGRDAVFTDASETSDVDGKRKLRVFFHADTEASARLDDGRIATLETFTLRASEYSTGARGIDAMPGQLPDLSAYTYAVELSVDELREVGVENVEFSKPVYLYLDNFLDFPTGSIVPSGFYDREASQSWQASKNGRVIKRVGSGIDITGDDKADPETALNQLGFSAKEIKTIIDTYAEGTSLWRVPVDHFSPYDLNWPQEFPEDAEPLSEDEIPDFPPEPEDENCLEAGSIVECQSQTLGKVIPIPGTDMKLWYRSDRVAGRGLQLVAHVSGAHVPSSLQSINAIISVGGKRFTKSFEAEPNLRWEFEWDGLDAYQRPVGRNVPVSIQIDFVFPTQYVIPADVEESFGVAGLAELFRSARITGVKSQTFYGSLGALDAKSIFGLGGWMVDLSTYFLGETQTLYLPHRPHKSGTSLTSDRIRTLVEFDTEKDGLLRDILSGPSGEIYLVVSTAAIFGQEKIFKLEPDGTYNYVAGKEDERGLIDGCYSTGNCGTGDDPTKFIFVGQSAVGNDGAIYFALDECIRRFDPEKMIHEDWAGVCNDEGFSREPEFDFLAGCERGLYATSNREGIRRFDSNGEGKLVAGFDQNADFDDTYDPAQIEGPALGKVLGEIISPTCAPDGDLFWIDEKGSIIKLQNGNISVYWANLTAESDPRNALFPIKLASAATGGPYMSVKQGQAIKIFKTEAGQVFPLVGIGFEELAELSSEEQDERVEGENIPAKDAFLVALGGFVGQDDGTLLIADRKTTGIFGAERVRIIESALSGGKAIIDPSGNTLNFFNSRGLIEKNVNARTGITNYEIFYDDNGFLEKIQRYDGLEMTIERDDVGNPNAIIGYFGIRTELSLNAEGYLDQIEYNNQTQHSFTYGKGGLLTKHNDQGGADSAYMFDNTGGLSRIDRPDGTWKTLTRFENTVTLNTSSGREVVYGQGSNRSGKSVTNAAGNVWLTIDEDNKTTHQHPNGSVIETLASDDPRFGSQATFTSSHRIEQPSGLSQEIFVSREIELSDPKDLLSVVRARDTVEKNGKKWSTEYESDSQTITKISPMGRKSVYKIDTLGRVVETQIGTTTKTLYTHSPGLLDVVEAGELRVAMSYDNQGFISNISTATHSLDIETDLLGQVSSLTQSGEKTLFERDDYGQVTNIATSNPWMSFVWDPNGQMKSRRFADGAEATFDYSEIGSLTRATQAGLPDVVFEYDDAQRLVKIIDDSREYTTTYDPTRGDVTQTTSRGVTSIFSYDGSLRTVMETQVDDKSGRVERDFDEDFAISGKTINSKRISYTRDGDGLLLTAGEAELKWQDDITLLESRKVGGIEVTHTYNELGQRTGSTWTGPGGFAFSEIVSADPNLRIETYEEFSTFGNKSKSYAFDGLSRLSRETVDGTIVSFSFDDRGNRTSVGGNTQTYDSSGRLESVGTTNYVFDAAGRMTTKASNTFTYDGFNQLLTANVGANTFTYGYDLAGNRVFKKRNGVLEKFWLYDDGSRPLTEFDGNGDLVTRFTYAENPSVPAYIEKDGKTLAVVTDYLGSVRFVVDTATGNIEQRLEYDAWGNILLDTNPGFQPFAFAGSMIDEDTGLLRIGARDYDAQSGQFTTADPSGLNGGTNPWAYVGGNPVSRIDPDGEFWVLVGGAAAIISGGAYILNIQATTVDSSRTTNAASELLGSHNGPGDALRHCTMNCRMTRKHGVGIAKTASWAHENPYVPFIGGQWENTPENPERIMDEHNNTCGQEIAHNQPSDKSCQRGCEEALLAGKLKTIDPSKWNGDESDQDKLNEFQTWRNGGLKTPFLRRDLR